jgi:hypothetical protein
VVNKSLTTTILAVNINVTLIKRRRTDMSAAATRATFFRFSELNAVVLCLRAPRL